MTTTATTNIPQGLVTGTYYVQAVADYTNQFTTETSKANNKLLGNAVTVAAPIATAFAEDFADNTIDLLKWSSFADVPVAVAEANQELEVFMPGQSAALSPGTSFAGGYRSRFKLTGDFDVQVELRFLLWPYEEYYGPNVSVGLVVADGSGTVASVQHNTYLWDYDGVEADFSPGGTARAQGMYSKLRLTRQGSVVTAYYAPLLLWQPLYTASVSSADLTLALQAWSDDAHFIGEDTKVAFDNLIIRGTIAQPLPDLSIASVAASPTVVAPGGAVVITDTVIAFSNAPVAPTQPFAVAYYLSSDPIITTSDVLIGTRTVAGLGQGQSSNGSTALTIPANLVGTFYVGAIVDPGNVIAEPKTNNTRSGNQITIDGDAPTIVVSGIADGGVSAATPLVVCWDAADPNLSGVTATLDGLDPTPGSSVGACTSVFLEGDHTLVVRAADSAGNVSTATAEFSLDFTPPQIIWQASVVDGMYTNSTSFVPAYTVVDVHPGPVAGLLDGQPYVPGSPITSEGSHRLVLTATDLASNSSSASLSFTIDRTAPTLTVSAPVSGATLMPGSVTFAGVTGDASPVTVTVNGSPVPVGSGGAFATALPLALGDHDVIVISTDAAGNAQAVSVRVAVCDVQPTGPCVSTWICAAGQWQPGMYAPATAACDDGNLCTHSDHCDGAGNCVGTPVSCSSGTCVTRSCNGTATCTTTYVASGIGCGDAMTPCASSCDGSGNCVAGVAASPGSPCPSSGLATCASLCDGVSGPCQPAE